VRPRVGKKIQSDLIGQKHVQDATEIPADFWALGFIDNIWGKPIGQEGVEYATELPADFEAQALVKKIRVTWSVRSKYKMLLNYQPTFVPWASLKISRVKRSVRRE